MKNFKQRGKSLDLIAGGGGVVSGQGYIHGSIFAVANETKAAGEKYAGEVEGVFEMAKVTANVMTEGLKVNWNDSNKEWQNATTDLDDAAVVVEAADGTKSLVKVKLTPL